MIKKVLNGFFDIIMLILGGIFTIIVAPIIYLSGLDKLNNEPTIEDIGKSQRLENKLHTFGKNNE